MNLIGGFCSLSGLFIGHDTTLFSCNNQNVFVERDESVLRGLEEAFTAPLLFQKTSCKDF